MSSKTKIIVLRMKEVIYTAIFLGLGILLITLGLIMFHPKQEKKETADSPLTPEAAEQTEASRVSAVYLPGIYCSVLSLGNQKVNLEVTVNSNEIRSIVCTPLNEAVETMYPLISPAVSSLAEQIVASQSLEHLSYSEGSFYTSQAIVNCIEQTLAKAALQ